MARQVLRVRQFKGISQRLSHLADSPEWLSDCVGFRVDPDGSLVTEPRWLDVPTDGALSTISAYKVRAMLAYPRDARSDPAVENGQSGFYYLVLDDYGDSNKTKVLKTVRSTAAGSTNWRVMHTFAGQVTSPISMAHFNDQIFLCVQGGTYAGLYADASKPPTPTSGLTGPIPLADNSAHIPRFIVPWNDRVFAIQPVYSRVRFANPGLGMASADWPVVNYFDVESGGGFAGGASSGTGIHGAIPTPSALYLLKGVDIHAIYGDTPSNWIRRKIHLNIGQTYNPLYGGVYDPWTQIVYVIDPNTNEFYGIRGGSISRLGDSIFTVRFTGHTQEILGPMGQIDQFLYIAPQGYVNPSTNTWMMEGGDAPPNYDYGFIVNLRNMAFTRSAYLRDINDLSKIWYWRAACYDANLGRLIIAADKPTVNDPHRIKYLDSNYIARNNAQRLNASQGLTAFAQTGYLYFGTTKLKRIHEIWVRASVLPYQSYTTPPRIAVTVRALTPQSGYTGSMGTFQQTGRGDQYFDPTDTQETTIPADGISHRISLPSGDPADPSPNYSGPTGRVVAALALRIEYAGSPDDVGIRIEEIMIDYEELESEVL